MNKLSILLVVALTLVFCLFACVPMQAEAAEEVATAADTIYYNYTFTCNNAPVFFQYPSYVVDNAAMTEFFNEHIGLQTIDGVTYRYIDMIYVLKHLDGTIYYQGIVRITNAPGIDMYVGVTEPVLNFNTTVGVSFPSTYSFTRISDIDSSLYAPNVTFATNSVNFKFKFFFSSIPGDVTLNELVLSAINLRDYLFYAYNPNPYTNNGILSKGAPWLDFYFTTDTPNSRQIQVDVPNTSITQTSEPTYPIIQSYDSIFNYGYNQGYTTGFDTAYDQGYNAGFDIGNDSGYNTGFNNGYTAGESAGFNQGVLESNDYSFLGLLTAVVDAPVTVLRETFNFNFLGFNVTTFIFSILTICLVIAILKKLV